MNTQQTTRISKFLSLVLRHDPAKAGIRLDEAGWTNVDSLLSGLAGAGKSLDRNQLNHIVETNAKKRFEFSGDGTRIRASQGHSVTVDLMYDERTPPVVLYHGTASRFLDFHPCRWTPENESPPRSSLRRHEDDCGGRLQTRPPCFADNQGGRNAQCRPHFLPQHQRRLACRSRPAGIHSLSLT